MTTDASLSTGRADGLPADPEEWERDRMNQLTDFARAATRTSATLHSGLRLLGELQPSDPHAATEAGWLDMQCIYGVGLAATVVPETALDFDPVDAPTDVAALAQQVRRCEQDLEAAFPETFTGDDLAYLTFVTEYANRLDTYVERYA